jgi:uncharacterized protein (TIGR03083 family)
MITQDSATMPVTTPQESVAQGEAEYAALLAMLRTLAPEDWSRPTDCPAWTVRAVVAHVNGAAEEAVRKRVQARHLLVARTRDRGVPTVDSLSAQQVADRAARTPDELVAELEQLGPAAPRARSRTPRFVRSRPMPADSGCCAGDTMGYLIDVIYSRDVWMHRIDVARATGCPMPTSDAEPAIVAQVVRDLSRGWARTPFTLTLTGRVEGSWRVGSGAGDAGEVAVDTVALCRLLSGRSDESQPAYDGPEAGLVDRLRQARVLF